MREIKFREFIHGKFHYWGFLSEGSFYGPATPSTTRGKHQQFTGLHDKNGKEIYEGDIFRIEEETDGLDKVFYVVITWVKEWCMFASLLIDEYYDYIKSGVSALDEPMFWTYTLEDTNSRKHFLCGNIYQTPELLNQ